MRIRIQHKTSYVYEHGPVFSAQYLRLTPLINASQRTLRWKVRGPGSLAPWSDGFGNPCHMLTLEQPTDRIEVEAIGVVETFAVNGVLPAEDGSLPRMVFLRDTPLTEIDERVNDFAQPFAGALQADRLDGLHQVMAKLAKEVAFQTGETNVHDTASGVLEKGAGVCQDMAHVFIASCRAVGIPARYVSGYLYDGEQSAAYAASHAWASAWVEDLGWVSFDAANETCGTERHIATAVALDYHGAAPVRGVRRGGTDEEGLHVAVTVAASQQ